MHSEQAKARDRDLEECIIEYCGTFHVLLCWPVHRNNVIRLFRNIVIVSVVLCAVPFVAWCASLLLGVNSSHFSVLGMLRDIAVLSAGVFFVAVLYIAGTYLESVVIRITRTHVLCTYGSGKHMLEYPRTDVLLVRHKSACGAIGVALQARANPEWVITLCVSENEWKAMDSALAAPPGDAG